MEHTPKPQNADDRPKLAEPEGGGCQRITLTPRERDCLQGLADGLSAKEMAHVLRISPRTVEHHIARAQAKMQAKTGAQAVARAVALGLIHPTQI